ncbi:MAG: hypothetical protein EHM40_07210 [Chloroflexi bacterium]|nr:MAG: hypothetical protein EHM40_07210 [Chloroflexota bacterium]
MQSRFKKTIVPGKVDRLSKQKFKIRKDKASEIDADIDIAEDGDYEVERLSLEGLPEKMEDGTPIRWFTNFAIKKNGQYINQRYTVTIPGLSSPKSRVVILDGKGRLYYYSGTVVKDTIELTDGDPGIGTGP